MSADPSFPPPVVPPAIRPSISIGISISEGYLADHGIDVGAVVNQIKTSLMNFIHDQPPDTVLTAEMLAATIYDQTGVTAVRFILLDGDTLPLPASGTGYLVDTANEIVVDCRISQ